MVSSLAGLPPAELDPKVATLGSILVVNPLEVVDIVSASSDGELAGKPNRVPP